MNPARERGRRRLVAVVTFIYLLLIFEGTLRKWVFPQYGQMLFFIRDPFVLIAYGIAFRHGFFPRNNAFLWIGIGFGLIAVLLVGAQTFNSNASGTLLLAAYGWRNYFYYIPLAFVIGESFQRQDLERIVRWTLILAIPTAALVFLQFMSPLNSPINVGSGDESLQFRGLAINGDHTRPMGFFTSDVGQKEFTVSAFAMALSLWLSAKAHRYMKFWLLLPCTCAVLSCLAVSGSRGAMLACGIVMIASMACALVIRGGGVSTRAVIWPSIIGIAAVGLYPILFPAGFEAFMGRWNTALADETRYFSLGIFGRALYGFIDFFSLMGDAPLAGWGLGLAGNARITLGIQIEGFTGWAETDWARHIVRSRAGRGRHVHRLPDRVRQLAGLEQSARRAPAARSVADTALRVPTGSICCTGRFPVTGRSTAIRGCSPASASPPRRRARRMRSLRSRRIRR
ncbi:MAG: hypothetical protein WDO68_09360 [Gammaproteobacteria bacterium]